MTQNLTALDLLEGQNSAKGKVSFGLGHDRPCFPQDVPATRFGTLMVSIGGAPNRGPGTYENEKVTNFEYQIESKIQSSKGYTLGARTGPRFGLKDRTVRAPDPGHYQDDNTKLREFETAYKPFSAASARFAERRSDVEQTMPGPGTYEMPETSKLNRKVHWHQTFGGTPINLPSIKQHSTIDRNTDKLLSTKDERKYNRRLAYLRLYYE